jgi:flagellar basal-body rod modification protein FlgD
LEELQNIRKALEAQQTASDIAGLSQAASFVGRQVQASTASVSFNGNSAVSLPYTLSSDAADVQVEIMNSAGQVVRTIHSGALSAGSSNVVWDGKSGSGSPLSPGAYSYRVTAFDAQGQPTGAAVAVSGVVESVRLKDGQPVFTVNGQTVRLQDVTAILQAAAN